MPPKPAAAAAAAAARGFNISFNKRKTCPNVLYLYCRNIRSSALFSRSIYKRLPKEIIEKDDYDAATFVANSKLVERFYIGSILFSTTSDFDFRIASFPYIPWLFLKL